MKNCFTCNCNLENKDLHWVVHENSLHYCDDCFRNRELKIDDKITLSKVKHYTLFELQEHQDMLFQLIQQLRCDIFKIKEKLEIK